MQVPAAAHVPLTQFRGGTTVLLGRLMMDGGAAQRLREMGLREGAQLYILKNDDKIIVVVDRATRIGLRREVGLQLLGSAVV